jgi:N-acetylmuramic acid 6-phosphate (MurNAc-6-P) etherase
VVDDNMPLRRFFGLQKIALNAFSTTIMVRLGKVHGPLMVDLRATNAKLRARARRIAAAIARTDAATAEAALVATAWRVKPAILMLAADLSPDAAEAALAVAKGRTVFRTLGLNL